MEVGLRYLFMVGGRRKLSDMGAAGVSSASTKDTRTDLSEHYTNFTDKDKAKGQR